MTKISHVGTFNIFSLKNGKYKIQDTCRFNDWGITYRDTLIQAQDYAKRSHDFKRGKRIAI